RPAILADAFPRKPPPPSHPFLSEAAEHLVVSTLKKAENGPALLLRMYEIEGAPAGSAVEFLGRQAAFREVNLLEEELPPVAAKVTHVRAHEIRTVKLTR